MRAWAALAGLVALASAVQADPPVEVRVSRQGFEPSVIRLHKGEPVRLLLRTSDEEHCFAVDELRIEKRILPGKATPLDFTPDRLGSFEFHCCLEPEAQALRGQLVVSE